MYNESKRRMFITFVYLVQRNEEAHVYHICLFGTTNRRGACLSHLFIWYNESKRRTFTTFVYLVQRIEEAHVYHICLFGTAN